MVPRSRWYVVHTQPNNESRADVNLRRQGFKTYLPRYLRKRSHARRIDFVPRCLFPRYLFVTLDLTHDRWPSIHSTFGVSHLISVGEKPVAITDAIIEEIRSREDENGFVTLGLPPGLAPGHRVRVAEGLFTDCQGVLERIAGQRRVAILLDLLGREVRVTLPAAAVRAA